MRMGNFLSVEPERSGEMAAKRPRLGIDHPTVVPTPAPEPTDGDEPDDRGV
jgi:hypothetical protein